MQEEPSRGVGVRLERIADRIESAGFLIVLAVAAVAGVAVGVGALKWSGAIFPEALASGAIAAIVVAGAGVVLIGVLTEVLRQLPRSPAQSLFGMAVLVGSPLAMVSGIITYTDKTLCDGRALSLKQAFGRCSPHGGELIGILLVVAALVLWVAGLFWSNSHLTRRMMERPGQQAGLADASV